MPSRRTVWFLSLALVGAGLTLVAQPAASSASGQAPTFRTKTSLVLVPVVVRDREGHAVGHLRKEDFQLFDGGKQQAISAFSVEATAGQTASPTASQAAVPAAGAAPVVKSLPTPAPAQPRRFVGYLFDDVHATLNDLGWARGGVERNLETLAPADRVAIFTTSGRTALDFTDDRAKLRETLLKLKPNPIARPLTAECPDVSHFVATVVGGLESQSGESNQTLPSPVPGVGVFGRGPAGSGAQALEALTLETIDCLHLDVLMHDDARRIAQAAVRRAMSAGQYETKVAAMMLKQVVRRVGAMPGQRTVIVLSPGFLAVEGAEQWILEAADLATRLRVVVSALDARGLYTGAPDIAARGLGTPWVLQVKHDLNRLGAQAEAGPLAELADGTGGRFVQNTNDAADGLKQIASPPEYLYLLGFSPKELEPDGRFHRLKVRLSRKQKLTVQARRGYYASKQLSDPAEAARRELEEAVFAPEDIHDPAVAVHTEFFKSGPAKAELAVLTHLDLERIRLQKAGGLNANDLTVVSCLFDRNGNFVAGKQEGVKLRLRDETLANRMAGGLTVKTSFETQPGTYAVRVAVRDEQGDLLSAESAVVEIP